MRPTRFAVALVTVSLSSCGGGGGDSKVSSSPTGPTTSGQAATVSASLDRSDVAKGAKVNITWSSTNATSCTASGGWSGAKAASGTEAVTITADGSLSLSCSGSGAAGSTSLPVTILKAGFAVTTNVPWMATPADLDGDGNQEIVMTTMGPTGFNAAGPRTPLVVLAVANNRLSDVTSKFFTTAPANYSGKVIVGDFDGNGKQDLYVCDRGRLFGPKPTSGATLTDGQYGSQNQVYMQGSNGILTNVTSTYLQTPDDSWGCSSGDIDKSGRETIAVNNFYASNGFPNSFLAKWDGTKFVMMRTLANLANGGQWGWTATADFDRDGYADVVGVGQVLWGSAAGGTVVALQGTTVEAAGFAFQRGAQVADFNGDGYPDLVRITGQVDSTLAGSRFALYAGGPNHTLTPRPNAFPALSSYNDSDFGNETAVLDINFDGFPDIVTFGTVYTWNSVKRAPTAVWINDGAGNFQLRHIADEIIGTANCTGAGQPAFNEAYFLKTKDPKAFDLVISGCAGNSTGLAYYARRVTPAFPLPLVP